MPDVENYDAPLWDKLAAFSEWTPADTFRPALHRHCKVPYADHARLDAALLRAVGNGVIQMRGTGSGGLYEYRRTPARPPAKFKLHTGPLDGGPPAPTVHMDPANDRARQGIIDAERRGLWSLIEPLVSELVEQRVCDLVAERVDARLAELAIDAGHHIEPREPHGEHTSPLVPMAAAASHVDGL